MIMSQPGLSYKSYSVLVLLVTQYQLLKKVLNSYLLMVALPLMYLLQLSPLLTCLVFLRALWVSGWVSGCVRAVF